MSCPRAAYHPPCGCYEDRGTGPRGRCSVLGGRQCRRSYLRRVPAVVSDLPSGQRVVLGFNLAVSQLGCRLLSTGDMTTQWKSLGRGHGMAKALRWMRAPRRGWCGGLASIPLRSYRRSVSRRHISAPSRSSKKGQASCALTSFRVPPSHDWRVITWNPTIPTLTMMPLTSWSTASAGSPGSCAVSIPRPPTPPHKTSDTRRRWRTIPNLGGRPSPVQRSAHILATLSLSSSRAHLRDQDGCSCGSCFDVHRFGRACRRGSQRWAMRSRVGPDLLVDPGDARPGSRRRSDTRRERRRRRGLPEYLGRRGEDCHIIRSCDRCIVNHQGRVPCGK